MCGLVSRQDQNVLEGNSTFARITSILLFEPSTTQVIAAGTDLENIVAGVGHVKRRPKGPGSRPDPADNL
jgi:hypothetical protein